MATFTFDEGNAFNTGFGVGLDNIVDVIDNGVTFRFVPVNPVSGGSITGAPGTAAPLTLNSTSNNTSFTMTLPASNTPGPAEIDGGFLVSASGITGAWTVTATDTNGAVTTLSQSGSAFFTFGTTRFVSVTFTAVTVGSLSIASLEADLVPGVAQDDAFTVFAMDPVLPGEDPAGDIVGDVHNDNGSGADTDADGVLIVSRINGQPIDNITPVTTTLGASVLMFGDGTFRYDGTGSTTLQNLALGATLTDTFTYRNLDSNTATVTLTVQGTGGRTIIDGTAGADAITPAINSHWIIAGDGNDTIIYDAASVPNFTGSIVDGGVGGDDTVLITYTDGTNPTVDLSSFTLTGIERLKLQAATATQSDVVMVKLSESQLQAISSFEGPTTGTPGPDGILIDTALSTLTTLDLSTKLLTGDVVFRITGDGDAETITGSASGDFIFGGAGADLIYGFDGDDIIFGGAGADIIYGGRGNEKIDVFFNGTSAFGDLDNDLFNLAADEGDGTTINGITVDGGAGTDALLIQNGVFDFRAETIRDIEVIRLSSSQNGLAGVKATASQLAGVTRIENNSSTGNFVASVEIDMGSTTSIDLSGATLSGFPISGSDCAFLTINGDGDNEVISGSAGCDVLYGGTGNDTLDGGADNDTIDGGAGNDSLNGGGGTDTLSYATATSGVTLFLNTGNVSVGNDNDVIVGFERFIGSAQADNLIAARNGSVTFIAGAGTDGVGLSGGTNTVQAGSGNDRVTLQANSVETGSVLDGGSDTDTLQIVNGSPSSVTQDLRDDTVTNFETLALLVFSGAMNVHLMASQVTQFSTFSGPPVNPMFPRTVPITVEIDMGAETSLDHRERRSPGSRLRATASRSMATGRPRQSPVHPWSIRSTAAAATTRLWVGQAVTNSTAAPASTPSATPRLHLA